MAPSEFYDEISRIYGSRANGGGDKERYVTIVPHSYQVIIKPNKNGANGYKSAVVGPKGVSDFEECSRQEFNQEFSSVYPRLKEIMKR